jgi:hypothetical protein
VGASAYRFLASAELDVVAAAGLEAMVRRRRRGAEAGAEGGEEGGLGHGGRKEEMGRQAKAAPARSKVEKLVRGDRRD